ncbi:hypothetical protein [Sinomonas sp. RB5]
MSTLVWWLSRAKWLAGFSFTVLIGAIAGTFAADPQTDWLASGRLGVAIACAVTLAIWVGLKGTEHLWGSQASRSSADEKILIDQLANVARRIADDLPSGKQNRHHAFVALAADVAHSLGRAYAKVVNDVRVVVYKYEDETLLPLRHSGDRLPSGAFTRDTQRGAAALDFVDSGDPAKFIRDVSQVDPGWQGSGSGYATFISAAIRSKDGPVGMLTIDAPRPGDLTGHDRAIATLAANVLSIAGASTSKR